MADHVHTTSPISRRALALGGGALSAVGITAGTAASAPRPIEPLSPIMAAASRLKALGAQYEKLAAADRDEEADAILQQEIEINDFIFDATPKCLGDAAVLLMVAAAEMSDDSLHEDGSCGHELGEIIVRRVMHFVAEMAGLDLYNHAGTYFLPARDFEALALSGTVAEASLCFNKIDAAEAARRHDEYRAMLEREIIMARHTAEGHQRVQQMVERAVSRWGDGA